MGKFILGLFSLTLVVSCGGGAGIDGPPGGGDGLPADAYVEPPLYDDGGQILCEQADGSFGLCECSDGIDNESPGDGFIDSQDPECSGPADNDESSFATGIPGDNMSTFAQDCFFDGDSGGGNDGCRWDIRCEDVTEPFEGQHCNNQQIDGCGTCQSLTPNGCDCFGCCTLYNPADNMAIGDFRLGESCPTVQDAIDGNCTQCTKVVDCQNDCVPCEYCIGYDPAQDPNCMNTSACAANVTECPTGNECAAGQNCIDNCCISIVQ